ncbi:hypothetical protein PM082_013885 [Marasmius tenuissimus]|nr:hypothetical protein PM082_013885 [Marasmius tenuissimus]
MPERKVIRFGERDVKHLANKRGKVSGLLPEHPSEHGRWKFHLKGLANMHGGKQTVTAHTSSASDTIFQPITEHFPLIACKTCTLPDSSDQNSEACSGLSFVRYPTNDSLPVSVAEIFNNLDAKGRLYCATRGKEMVVGFGQFIVRVHFALEGHCFWMPTTQYNVITSKAPVTRGSKSMAYRVPLEFVYGPGGECRLSIQAAFIRPDWTLLFCDHNVQIVFHVMRLRRDCEERDFDANSTVCVRR